MNMSETLSSLLNHTIEWNDLLICIRKALKMDKFSQEAN